jgi:cbb3-type cytochrome c oxidase subunit III
VARLAVLAALGGGLVAATAPAAPQGADKALVARGDSIFHGKLANGLCWTCHGMDAKGMKGLGPDLTDKTWLHGDGSLAFIVSTVKTGIAKPKKSSTPMLPGGGMPLTEAQVAAVAAYVESLSAGAKR